MKVWVIMARGSLYPIGYDGGRPGFVSEEMASETMNTIIENDRRYDDRPDGVHLEIIEASEDVLSILGIKVKR